ncbi:putative ubiquitin-conjugating enzyme E2-binding protein [Lupinus albus]|uniref:Putative ubiquitin-conjugating enzyme E2-binding protein n=1 Tax=Lupinus albus TaxID=3870 RepID=A0A6A4P556_LUPAL|nr:putative ubiquitin-conjugating enzyme E2-binding protein [Lupinus albus]
MCGDIECSESKRRKWVYTWESQSHTPTLRLFLFTTHFNPSLQCHNLTVQFHFSHSHLLLLTWFNIQDSSPSNFVVPIPRVLVDSDSPINFRAFNDHIEVKLILLLPVDHRILSGFSLLEDDETTSFQDASISLIMESDVDKLSSAGEVNFYCRNCAFKLTRNSLKSFVEMPSTNWREVADNWFGTCCCSFGGISEKLVVRYANSYTCAQGVCLLSSTSVTLCKDDVVENNFPEGCKQQQCDSVAYNHRDDGVGEGTINYGSNREKTSTCSDTSEVINALDENSRFAHPENEKLSVNLRCEVTKNKLDHGDFSHSRPDSNITEDVAMTHSCCSHMTNILQDENSEHHLSDTSRKQWMPSETVEILENQKSFLNGYLEDVFMARSSNISKDINWHEFTCPQCSSILGAYPCCEGHAPVDGGVRLFKCYISTCVPVGGAGDMFSKYTMDKMFANQLMECANDETTFRFVIRDMVTKSPVLQIILLNPDTWSCSGTCYGTEEKIPVPTLQLQPTIKVLFYYCNTATESQLRMIEEWGTKNSAENIFMLTGQLQELERSLMSAKDIYPPSCASLQGLLLSYVQR